MTNNLPATYEAGELLNLRLPALRYDEPRHGGHRLVGDAADGEAYEIVLPAGARYELERVAPAEWPPVAGDIWTDRFLGEWMALDTGDGDPWSVRLRNADDDSVDSTEAGEVAENWGPMRLLRRRGWSPTPPAAEPEPPAPPTPTELEYRAAWIAGAHEALDWLESHPEVRLPHLGFGGSDQLQKEDVHAFSVYTHGAEAHQRVDDAYRAMGPEGVEEIREDGRRIVYRRFGPVAITVSTVISVIAASKVAPKPEPAPAEPEPAPTAAALAELAEVKTLVKTIKELPGTVSADDAEPVDQAAEPAPVEQPQDWYFTFGHGQTDKNGFSLTNHYVVLNGTYDTARARMLELFGNNWSFQYSSAEAAGVERFRMKPLPAEVLDEAASAPDKPVPAIAAHYETGGWKGEGVDGKCGVECACGVTFDGFDTLADAAAALDQHIEAGE